MDLTFFELQHKLMAGYALMADLAYLYPVVKKMHEDCHFLLLENKAEPGLRSFFKWCV